MNERLKAILSQIAGFWQNLSTGKRAIFVASTVGVSVMVLAISFFAGQEHYATLYSELNGEDAQAMATKLKELKVNYKLDGHGTSILVPVDKVDEVRLELAGAGLPRGGSSVGNEIFDKTKLGATEFEQRVQKQRALEGELSRTIGSLAAVGTARVHLVMPERSIFSMRREFASASVLLKLRTGRALSKGEIGSVVHLVTSAVPGLTTDHVSVVTTDGQTLHRPRGEAGGGGGLGGGDQEEKEAEYAMRLQDKARELLERTVGAGHADVRVSVDLDLTAKETTSERYDPQKAVIRSKLLSKERSQSASSEGVAGVPGANNTPPAGDNADNGGENSNTSGSMRESSTENWDIDKVVEKTLAPAGRVARVSVAVLVDGKQAAGKEFIAREKDELERLGELVKSAVGFNATRGDGFRIESAAFVPPPDIEAAAKVVEEKQMRARNISYGLYVGGALAVAAAVYLLMKKMPKAAPRPARATATAALTNPSSAEVRELARAVIDTVDRGAFPPGASDAPRLPGASILPEEVRERVRTEALSLAAKDPASAAVVLREWLNSPQMSTRGE